MVLINVDLPRPVWPAGEVRCALSRRNQLWKLTNADDVELEAPLDELLLNLLRDAVETDMARRVDRARLAGVRGSHCGRLNNRQWRGYSCSKL